MLFEGLEVSVLNCFEALCVPLKGKMDRQNPKGLVNHLTMYIIKEIRTVIDSKGAQLHHFQTHSQEVLSCRLFTRIISCYS